MTYVSSFFDLKSVKRFKISACTDTSRADVGSLVPSFAHGMALPSAVAGAVVDSATNFFNSSQSAEEGAAQLVASMAAAM